MSGFLTNEDVRRDLNSDIDYEFNKLKCLERPITDKYSSYNDKRKRHNLYVKDQELNNYLKSGELNFKFYSNKL